MFPSLQLGGGALWSGDHYASSPADIIEQAEASGRKLLYCMFPRQDRHHVTVPSSIAQFPCIRKCLGRYRNPGVKPKQRVFHHVKQMLREMSKARSRVLCSFFTASAAQRSNRRMCSITRKHPNKYPRVSRLREIYISKYT